MAKKQIKCKVCGENNFHVLEGLCWGASLDEDGVTDSIEYAHFVWRKDYKPKFSKLRII